MDSTNPSLADQRRGYSHACTVAHSYFLQLRKVAQLDVKATHSCA